MKKEKRARKACGDSFGLLDFQSSSIRFLRGGEGPGMLSGLDLAHGKAGKP